MSYDCLIIGGGLSGLTCGIKCASEGLRTVMLSGGMNSLHFSSGSIDLFGYKPGRKVVYNPFDYIKNLSKSNQRHPYSKIGLAAIKESLKFIKSELMKSDLHLYNNGQKNHFHVTGLGLLKPSYFSQVSVFNQELKEAFEGNAKIAVLNFEGYRDFYAELALEQLKKNRLMKNEITIGTIRLPYYTKTEKNLHEFRSIDLARVFDSEKYLPLIADEIKKAAGDAEIASLPAFIGIHNFNSIHKKLQEMTGLLIYEVPSLPPSILGMRLDNALKGLFVAYGGEFSEGDKVIGGDIIKGRVNHIYTENYKDVQHKAKFYLLSTGSFFSGGLSSKFNHLEEPIFNLKFNGKQERKKWHSPSFFDKKSHPFLEYGVETNKSLNTFDKNGKVIKNLFCSGAILSGYNPIKEGSGGGVAISTGYYVAQKIIKGLKDFS